MSDCPHSPVAAATPSLLLAALAAAEGLCNDRGEQWTAPRRRTYELLFRAGVAVRAYDLVAAYPRPGEGYAAPATIYRALDFLTSVGLVHRIESLNAFLACRSNENGDAPGFLICDCCGRVAELDLGANLEVKREATELGFMIKRMVLEAHGLCADCRTVTTTR
jgi:Fur family zinc uptake transcriptional regulator